MTVREIGKNRYKIAFKLFEFSDFDSVLGGILALYKRRRFVIKSSLYKMPEVYRLTVFAKADQDLLFMNEFCVSESGSLIAAAYTEEHGKLIAKDEAIEQIGRAFFKGF